MYAVGEGVTKCSYCPTGRSSIQGSPVCSLAALNYYLHEPKSASSSSSSDDANGGNQQAIVYVQEAKACPPHATCAGGNAVPVPREGYWVDRSSSRFAGRVFRCEREACEATEQEVEQEDEEEQGGGGGGGGGARGEQEDCGKAQAWWGEGGS